jgi:hypothetical protein
MVTGATLKFTVMNPGLLISTRDAMALSGVSERTAKRHMAVLKKHRRFIELRTYCSMYHVDYKNALAYVLSKRYDLLHCFRVRRVEMPPYAYEIRTWEEGYVWQNAVRKILFHEIVFLDTDGRTPTGRLRYVSLPVDYMSWYGDFFIGALEGFVPAVFPVESIEQLLEFYGLMVFKRSRQRSIGFVLDFEVCDAHLFTFSQAMRSRFRNTKHIWFCRTDLVSEGHRKVLGFWEITGTGHAISGVPGYDRRGKVRIRVTGRR